MMRITQEPFFDAPGEAEGILHVEVDGHVYTTDIEQKPLLYGYELLVFDDTIMGDPPEVESIHRHTIKTGAISETTRKGSLPSRDVTYERASDDPLLLAVAQDWLKGRLPMGKIDLEKYR